MSGSLSSSSWMIPVLPLAAFLINGLILRTRTGAAALVAIVANAAAAVWAVLLAREFFSSEAGACLAWSFPWMKLGPIDVSIGGWLDGISVMMLVVVTLIATLVHVYSVGYMHDDPGAGRFFALLPFFVFAMLGLVLAANLIQLYIFWELVGLASYLLIGFWYTKPSAVAASKKAFIITRFADAFFLIGIVVVATITGKIDFQSLNSAETVATLQHTFAVGSITLNLLTVCTLLIFAGGWGKSALFPLHVWLPDAMEGPTPVSSIIHSATMVVAGVFLAARLYPLFAASEMTLRVIEVAGVTTAVFAAVVACLQTDLKRILAYSTLSQIGYMMFGLGTAASAAGVVTSGFTASMFHVFTHAFFKCMLFLIAGILIHAVHHNDLSAMGGLRRKFPLTYAAAWIGCLALAGVYPFSGFFSKDMILLTAWSAGHPITFGLGLFTGGLTAFYMFRALFLAFHGASRGHAEHAHEGGTMLIPVLVLAVPSAIIGLLAEKFFHHRIHADLLGPGTEAVHVAWLPIAATATGIGGLLLAWLRFGRAAPATTFEAPKSFPLRVVKGKFFIDEVWLFVTHWVAFGLIAAPARWLDKWMIDGSMDATAWITQKGGAFGRRAQNGQVQFYVAGVLAGVALLCVLGGLVS